MISVVIPTFNRAKLLSSSLESLCYQSVARTDYEVVVVNDGSTDETGEVCRRYSRRLPLRYLRIENSGISAAKNLGIFASQGQIVLFFDDDDIAHPNLLAEHLKAHERHPNENVAFLGFTTWDPQLNVTPVMDYVMNIGQVLFAYRHLEDGQSLDFHYFWGGRSSCKRSLLVRHGVFDQRFRFIIEDIELAYRLWKKVDLKVIYHRNAISYMTRPVSFEQFCTRCERQGAALVLFAGLHPDRVVQEYCQIVHAEMRWNQWKDVLGVAFFRVREIEAMFDGQSNPLITEELKSELHRLYAWTFNGFKTRGLLNAGDEGTQRKPLALPPSPLVEPVVIYQMGKVGSKTIETSLRALDLGIPICHSHLLHDLDQVGASVKRSRSNPHETLKEIEHGKQLRKTILGTPYVRCRVISLVRDPVARNISAFFQNITEFIPDLLTNNAGTGHPKADIINTFLSRYDHAVPANWFQHQLKPVFGVDVFSREFPKDCGYAIYETDNVKLLVIKLEKLESCVADAMREFLGIQKFVLINSNVGEEKAYRNIYKEFLSSVVLPEDYLNQMYDTQFARQFYTDVEIEEFRARWSRQIEPISRAEDCM